MLKKNNYLDHSSFRNSYSFNDRLSESTKMIAKYPDIVPVICEKNFGSKIQDIDKHKYLISTKLIFGNFIWIVRNRINLQSHEALFLFVGGNIPVNTATFAEIYHLYKNPDGFLYITYCKENTFGQL